MCPHIIALISYHSVIKDAIRHWLPGVVLGVKCFADHVDVGLLAHLLRREEAKLQMASAHRSQV